MVDVLKDLSSESLAEAIEWNLFGLYATFGRIPNARVDHHPNVMRVRTGLHHELLNGIFRAQFPTDDIDVSIREVLDVLRRGRGGHAHGRRANISGARDRCRDDACTDAGRPRGGLSGRRLERGVERFPCTGEAGLQAVLPARPVYADGMGWTRAERVGVARGDPGLAGDGVSVRRRDVATNPVRHRV